MKPEPKWWHSAWVKWGAITLIFITGFYAHENLLGALAWKKTRQEVAAAGESLAPVSFLPPPIPDEQNLGSIPLFLEKAIPGRDVGSTTVMKSLERVKDIPYSLKVKSHGPTELPFLGLWKKGEQPDMAAVHARLAELCHLPATTKQTSLQLFAQLCPLLTELRAASVTHPECQFLPDTILFARSTGGAIQLRLTEVLRYEARLAFLEGDPALALQNIELGWKLMAGRRFEANVVQSMLTIGLGLMCTGSLAEGLGRHTWDDGQLAQLDQELGKMDCLELWPRGIRNETLELIPLLDDLNRNRSTLAKSYYFPSEDIWSHVAPSSWADTLDKNLTPGIAWLVPSGWVVQYKSDTVRYRLLHLVTLVNPGSHRCFPVEEADELAWLQKLPSSQYWQKLLSEAVILSRVSKQFAYAQISLDQARIACRLERYRLAHGAYPSTLEALEPVYGPNPHDTINGQSYHYRLSEKGSYLLYSVGWNKTDDGGHAENFSVSAPDWAWFCGPNLTKTK